MTTNNHTIISDAAAANAGTINAPLGELDEAIGDVAAVNALAGTGVAEKLETERAARVAADALYAAARVAADDALAALIGAAASVSGSIGTSIDTDGTLKAGAVDNAAVLASAVVTAAKLDTSAVTVPNVVVDPFNERLSPTLTYRRQRWKNPTALAIVSPDTSNPYGLPTLRFSTVSTLAGKAIWLDEMGAAVGDTISYACEMKAASGSFYFACRYYTSAEASLGSQSDSGTFAFSGTAQTLTISGTVVPATAAFVVIYVVRVSGSADADIYAMWGSRTAFVPAEPTPSIYPVGPASSNGIPLPSSDMAPAQTWGHRERFMNPAGLTLIDDATSIFGYEFETKPFWRWDYTAATLVGVTVHLDEIGAREGDVLSFVAAVKAASGTYALNGRFRDAANANYVGGQVSGTTSRTMAGAVQVLGGLSMVVPATAASVRLYVSRASGSATTADIYGIWGGLGPVSDAPIPAVDARFVRAFALTEDVYGKYLLRSWFGQVAKIQQADTTSAGVVAMIGDSWINNDRIHRPLTSALQTLYGDAGPGYVGIGNDHGATEPVGVTSYAKVGTWTELDNADPGRGVDIADSTSTDTATPAKVTIVATCTSAVIHYLKKANGGSFRWRVDAGAWTTVATANASDLYATETISGLSAASHTLEIEVSVAGVAGVTLFGVDLQESGNGVRVHRLGNSGATAAEYVAANSTLWAAALTALAPNLAVVLLGTNDDSADVAPATFGGSMDTIIDRIQAALPLCDVLVLTPGLNGLAAGTYTTATYIQKLRDVAVRQDAACFDASMTVGAYTNANSRGLWENTSHINELGAQVVASGLVRVLRAE